MKIKIDLIMKSLMLFSVIVLLRPCFTCYGADKLDPFNAEFQLIQGTSNIKATLDFCIHNAEAKKLAGSKFICNEEIESVSVADEEGNKMPFTIKLYPRKRIIWQYPLPKDGKRRVIISFIIKNALKKQKDGTHSISIDWIGWNREVLNSNIAFLFPADNSEFKITNALIPDYKVVSTPQGTKVFYDFPQLTAKIIGFDFIFGKNTEQAEKKAEPAPAVAEGTVPKIKDIRISVTEDYDRLVFDLSRTTRCTVDQGEKQITISWQHPVTVSEKLLKKKVFRGKYINSLQWRREPDNLISCVLNIKIPEYSIKYNHLEGPPRLYMDVFRDEEQQVKEKTVSVKEEPIQEVKADPPSDFETLPDTSKLAEKQEQPVFKEKLPWLMEEEPELFASDKPATEPVKDQAPIQESIALTRAKTVFEAGDYENAINAFDAILERFPQTVLREEILFLKADSYYRLIEDDKPETLQNAVRAYKQAIENFPRASKSQRGHYRIAECYRKLGFYPEAISQFGFFITTYPESKLLSDAKFWTAESYYQMKNYDEALKLFEKFTFDFPQDPNAKMATFRIGDCYFKLNDFDRAEYYYEKAIKKWPDISLLPADMLNNIAINNYFKGKFNKSREIAFLSFNLFPEQEQQALLLRFIGDSYQWDGQMQNALNIYRNIIDIFPSSDEVFYAVMRIADIGVNVEGLDAKDLYFNTFNPYKEPGKAYNWIISNKPARTLLTEAYYKLGFLKAKQEQYAESVRFFKKAMEDRERTLYYQRSFENIQKILAKLILNKTAEQDYFSSVQIYKSNLNPYLRDVEDFEMLFHTGVSFLELGFLKEAEELFKNIINNAVVAELKHKATVCTAKIEMQRGNFVSAEEIIKILLFGEEQVSETVQEEAYHILADAVYKLEKFNEAKNFYTTALQKPAVDERQIKSLFRAADSMEKTGYSFNAIQLLRKAIETANKISPETEKILSLKNNSGILLAELLVKSGEYSSAEQILSQVAKSTDDAETKGWALFNRLLALSEDNNFEAAATVFEKITDEAPDEFFGIISKAMLESMKMQKTIENNTKDFM